MRSIADYLRTAPAPGGGSGDSFFALRATDPIIKNPTPKLAKTMHKV
jgi:hypothetical protein